MVTTLFLFLISLRLDNHGEICYTYLYLLNETPPYPGRDGRTMLGGADRGNPGGRARQRAPRSGSAARRGANLDGLLERLGNGALD